MKKFNLMIVFAAILFTAGSCKDDDEQIPVQDSGFVVNAADGGMFEVKAGELAVAKGSTKAMGSMMMGSDSMSVKSFGQMMITDHTMANNELMALASKKNINVANALTLPKQQKLDSLMALSGQAFDMTYTKMMVASHVETVNLFQNEANSGGENELKTWASGKLPTLKHHLEMAQMMQASIK